jgi:hypothetical protein
MFRASAKKKRTDTIRQQHANGRAEKEDSVGAAGLL